MATETVEQEIAPAHPSFTDGQLRMMFNDIATTALTLTRLAMGAMEEAGRTDAANDWHVVQMLAERIGAIADLATDGDVRGGVTAWMIGPLFDGQTSEVAHG